MSRGARPQAIAAIVVLGIAAAARALAAEPSTTWSAWSASPRGFDEDALAPLERSVLRRCGTGEAGLQDAAQAVVARKLHGLPIPELDELAQLQRASGEPHPWPRAWLAVGRALLEQEKTMAKLDAWLGPKHGAERRCGVASATLPDGARVLAVVSVDAFADLLPIPTHARAGQWLLVEGRLRAPARGGEVIVLGPSGAPRAVPASFDGRTIRARFAPERPGEFTVQVLADVGAGLRPVLEAAVFADVAPDAGCPRTAPGEERGAEPLRDDELLARMIDAARESAGLPRLARDRRLDDVARHHAARMAHVGELAHELGEGDPLERLRAAGVEANYASENVAHASTLRLAHRELWASPSHRANLLRSEYERLGVGVVRDLRGDVWVVEMFTGD